MLCAACGESVHQRNSECPACGGAVVLDGRYVLEGVLGEGGSGVTYRALELPGERPVCVKELRYSRLRSFDAERLFSREARVLRQLDHRGVVRYVDDFTAGEGRNLAMYLVQELIEGVDLAEEMRRHRYTEDEVLAAVGEIASVLAYLHGLSPPVVHRDLKPSNVLRRSSDGRLVLVDFGAVRDAIRETVSGSATVTGTFGYMAPEQLYGQATPACDLYALGVLAVVLLCQRAPAELVDEHNRLDWQGRVPLSPGCEALLEALLQPDPTRRLADAAAVQQRVRELRDGGARDALRVGAATAATQEKTHPARRTTTPAAPPTSPRVLARPDRAALLHRRPATPYTQSTILPPGSAMRRGATGMLALAVGVALLLFVAVLASGRDDKAPGFPASEPPAAHSSAGGKRGAGAGQAVIRGLKGLRFGMSTGEAAAALPEILDATHEGLPSVQPTPKGLGISGLLLQRGGAAQPMAGTRLRLRTTLAHQPATCLLDFPEELGLSRVDCTFDGLSSLQAHQALETMLLRTLRERSGREHAAERPDRNAAAGGITGMMQVHEGSWRWRDAGASLELTSRFQVFLLGGHSKALPPTSKMRLVNTSAEHEAEEARLRAQADLAADRLRVQHEQAERATREAELRKLRESGAGSGPDL